MAGGIIRTDLGGTDTITSIIMQGNQKILVAGSSNADFALARYNLNGTLDTSFGNAGIVKTDFGSLDTAYSVALQNDGKIVVGGVTNADFAIARYTIDGILDGTFDGDGRKISDFGSNEAGRSVSVQTDGKILLAGYGSYKFALLRYNADGSTDTSFGTNGIVTTSAGPTSSAAYSVALQPTDQKILVSGDGGPDFALVRYNTDGTLDSSFSGDGKALTSVNTLTQDHSAAITMQTDGKILVAGYGYANFALLRYNLDGTLDTSFDTDGIATTDFGSVNSVTHDYATSLALQADGKILVAGQTNKNFGLVRYNTDGSRDDSFDLDGKVSTDIGFDTDYAYSVTVQQEDQKILVAGTSNNDFVLIRYNPDGSLDTTFNKHISALDHLATYNVSVHAANSFIMANISSPETIYNVSKTYGVTTEMLAQIVGNNITQNDVIGFFTAHGLNPSSLDLFA